jgi:sporadic carbohydrate cluster protein (TIGR04323 family)
VLQNRVGYRGYVTSRPFGGLYVPVPMQSLTLRDYCARHKLLYKLHVNENMFPHSYMVLESLVLNLNDLQGILMCSIFMLPERPERRSHIYRKVFEQGAEIRFVQEELIVAKAADVEPIEEILSIYNTLPMCPQTLPAGLIED